MINHDFKAENLLMKVLSVNISEKKGTIKKQVPEIIIGNRGIYGDAHAGNWNRQVSLLGNESIQKFVSAGTGRQINFGEFAENITTEGIELWKCHPLDHFEIAGCKLMVTQIGKECHGNNCSIFRETGDCVMPKEGIFCRVLKEGKIIPGDQIFYYPKKFKILVITLSDRASSGEYEDLSGPRAHELVRDFFTGLSHDCEVENILIPDDPVILEKIIFEQKGICDVILTTGGTGIGPRDITPETIRRLIQKEIPGIMEFIRFKYGSEKPQALLSRSIAGTLDNCLVYTLPGSVRAVNEYMNEILKTLLHSIYMIHGLELH